MKFLSIILGLILMLAIGIFIGREMERTEMFYIKSPTTVYTANTELLLTNGGVLPQGSELFYDTSFPEGFTRLKLYVNTEQLTDFDIRKDSRPLLKIPYWAAKMQNKPQ